MFTPSSHLTFTNESLFTLIAEPEVVDELRAALFFLSSQSPFVLLHICEEYGYFVGMLRYLKPVAAFS